LFLAAAAAILKTFFVPQSARSSAELRGLSAEFFHGSEPSRVCDIQLL
jgi:hypothetical protein